MAVSGSSLAITVGIYAIILIASVLLFSKSALLGGGWQAPRQIAGSPARCRALHPTHPRPCPAPPLPAPAGGAWPS